MVSADGKSEIVVARTYKSPSNTRMCEICHGQAQRLVDVKVDGELLEFYLLCGNNQCLNTLASQILGV